MPMSGLASTSPRLGSARPPVYGPRSSLNANRLYARLVGSPLTPAVHPDLGCTLLAGVLVAVTVVSGCLGEQEHDDPTTLKLKCATDVGKTKRALLLDVSVIAMEVP